jgi:hypothetical protein
VRLWDIAAPEQSILHHCTPSHLGFIGHHFFWIWCTDRLAIQSPPFEPRGEIFFNDEGLIATAASEGVYVPTDGMLDSFRAIAPGGQILWQRHSVPEVSAARVRQVLFDGCPYRKSNPTIPMV